MAERTEVFSAELNIESPNLNDLIGEVEKLDDAVNKLAKTFQDFSKVDVSIRKVDSSLEQFAKRVDEIGLAFGKRGGFASSSIQDIRKFGAVFQETFNQLEGNSQQKIQQVANTMGVTVDNIITVFKRLEGQDFFEGVVRDAQDMSTKLVGRSIVPEMVAQIEKEYQQLRAAGQQIGTDELTQRFRGLALAATTSGARLQGIREAFAGTGQSSNILIQGLDKIIGTTNQVKQFQGLLQSQIQATANTMERQIVSARNQANTLRALAAAEDIPGRAAQQLSAELTKVLAAFKQVQVSTASGIDPTRSVNRLNTEVNNLELEMEHLTKSGVIPAGSATAKAFDQFLADLKNSQSGTQALTSRVLALNKRMQEQASREKERAKAAGLTVEEYRKQNTIFGKLSSLFSSIISGFKRSTSATKQGTLATKTFNTTMKATSTTVASLKNVLLGTFLGVFGGNILFNAINRIRTELTRLPGAVVSLASRAEESMSKFQNVFKETASGISQDLDALAIAMGRSALSLKEQAAAFQDTFVPLGFARDDAAKLSKNLVTLTQDVASFNNKNPADVQADFQSALVGNTETVRKYGIIITQAALDQELMNLGVEGGVQAATEAQKVLARYSLIVKGTGDAQGDAIRTGDSWANQLRRLQAGLETVALSLGQKILPAIAPFLRILNELVVTVGPAVISKVTELSQSLFQFASRLATTLQNVLSGTINLNDNLSVLVGSIVALFSGDWAEAWNLFLLIVDDALLAVLDFLADFAAQGFDWGFNFMSSFGDGIISAAQAVLDAVVNIANQIAQYLASFSPPKKGPLSSIDVWGKNLAELWAEGFFKTNLSGQILDFLDPIADTFAKTGEEGLHAFKLIAKGLDTVISGLQETGQLNEQLLDQVLKNVDDPALRKAVKDQLQAQAELADINQQVADAQAAGFVPAQLQLQQRAAQAKVDAQDKELDTLKKIQGFEDKINPKEKEKAEVAAAKAVAAASTKANEKIQKSNQELFQEKLDLLNKQRDAGVITEEEYVSQAIKIREEYVKDLLAQGADANDEEIKSQVAVIDELKAQLDTIKEAKKDVKIKKADLIGDFGINDLGLPNLFDEAVNTANEAGGKLSDGFGGQIKDKVSASVEELKNNVIGKFNEIGTNVSKSFSDFFNKLKGIVFDFRDSVFNSFLNATAGIRSFFGNIFNNIKGFLTGIGLLLPLLLFKPVTKGLGLLSKTLPVLKTMARLGGRLATTIFPKLGSAATAVGNVIRFLATKGFPLLRQGFLTVIRISGPTIIKLTGIGLAIAAVIYGIISNIDQLIIIFDDLKARASESIGRLIELLSRILGFDFGGLGSGLNLLSLLGGILLGIFDVLNQAVQAVLPNVKQFFSGLFEAISGVLVIATGLFDFFTGLFALLTGNTDIATEAFTSAFENLREGLARVITGLLETLPALLTLSPNLVAGFLGGLLDLLGLNNLANLIRSNISRQTAAIQNAFRLIIDIIENVFVGGGGLQAIFERIGLGQLGQILSDQLGGAFQTLSVAFQGLSDVLNNQVLPIFTSVFGVIKSSVQDAIGVISDRLASLQPLWDLIIAKLAELGISFDGDFSFIQTIISVAAAVIIGTVVAIIGVFVGLVNGIASAVQTISSGIQLLVSGVQNQIVGFIAIFQGLVDFFTSVFAGDWQGAFDALQAIGDGFATWFGGLWQVIQGIFEVTIGAIISLVAGFVTSIVDFFRDLYTELVGQSIVVDLVNDIISWFAALPERALEFVNQLIDRVKSAFSSFDISSLLGGGTTDTTTQTTGPATTLDTAALQTEMSGFQTAFQTHTAMLQTIWQTFLLAKTQAWAIMLDTLNLGLQTFQLNYGLVIQNLQLRWQQYLFFKQQIFLQTMQVVADAFQAFYDVVASILQAIIDLINAVGEAFIALADTIAGATDDISGNIDDLKDDLGDLQSVVKDLESAFRDLQSAASDAMAAASGSIELARGTLSLQGGTLDTGTGNGIPALLHPHEAVLNRPVADAFRSLLASLNTHGVGNAAFNFGLPPVGGAALNGNGDLVGNPIQYIQNNEFHTIINERTDEALFEQKVLRIVSRAVPRI